MTYDELYAEVVNYLQDGLDMEDDLHKNLPYASIYSRYSKYAVALGNESASSLKSAIDEFSNVVSTIGTLEAVILVLDWTTISEHFPVISVIAKNEPETIEFLIVGTDGKDVIIVSPIPPYDGEHTELSVIKVKYTELNSKFLPFEWPNNEHRTGN